MTRWFITPDLHGNRRLADKLLEAAGVRYSPPMRRQQGVVAVQLGDLANCVARDREADEALIGSASSWYDVVLVGNHEHPYFGGPRFSGFAPFPEIEEGLRDLERAGILRPCLLAGDVLLTHAGVTPEWAFDSAAEAAAAIEREWERRQGPTLPLFSRIGRLRGGWDPLGGILWSDFHEPRAAFRQIHGHTAMEAGPFAKAPDGEPVRVGVRSFPGQGTAGSLNLDVGQRHGRIVGAWLEEDGAVELVEYREP